MTNDRHFAELVSVACHDILTPLATVYGFARTLEQLRRWRRPAPRYVEMIGAASAQIDELVDQLRLVARIESGKYEPALAERDSLELAREASALLEEGRVTSPAAARRCVSIRSRPLARSRSSRVRRRASAGTTASRSTSTERASPSRRSPAPPARSSWARKRESSPRRPPRSSSVPSAGSSRPATTAS